jgi:hypothetical protein
VCTGNRFLILPVEPGDPLINDSRRIQTAHSGIVEPVEHRALLPDGRRPDAHTEGGWCRMASASALTRAQFLAVAGHAFSSHADRHFSRMNCLFQLRPSHCDIDPDKLMKAPFPFVQRAGVDCAIWSTGYDSTKFEAYAIIRKKVHVWAAHYLTPPNTAGWTGPSLAAKIAQDLADLLQAFDPLDEYGFFDTLNQTNDVTVVSITNAALDPDEGEPSLMQVIRAELTASVPGVEDWQVGTGATIPEDDITKVLQRRPTRDERSPENRQPSTANNDVEQAAHWIDQLRAANTYGRADARDTGSALARISSEWESITRAWDKCQ